jgi:hypothetical protein
MCACSSAAVAAACCRLRDDDNSKATAPLIVFALEPICTLLLLRERLLLWVLVEVEAEVKIDTEALVLSSRESRKAPETTQQVARTASAYTYGTIGTYNIIYTDNIEHTTYAADR